MAEARSLVFPRALALGARPLTVPGRGSVLVASAFHAFRLSDGAHVMPADWYQTVATEAGANVVPDTMVPLPGAELLVLGPVPPLAGDRRVATIRCGGLAQRVVFLRDADAPDLAFAPDAAAAVWDAEDNPLGRGGPDDDRRPLIVAERDSERPVWLGPTAFDHPLRLRLVGTPDAASGTGWPADADPAVFHEAHPAWWTRSFSPGDPLALEGLGAAIATRLPPYRITITSGHEDGRFVVEAARIHGVTVVPCADLGAVFWRAVIDVGDDILGENVQALVAALEDADGEPRDEEHWGRIAVNRWLEPDTALDDRPLLPAAMAAAVTLPFAMPDDDPMKQRHDAAEQWMKGEAGIGETNPFGELAPDEHTALAGRAIEASEKDDAPPDANEIDDIASGLLAASRKRHEEAGFEERSPEDERAPQRRGESLEEEIRQRLAAPYQSVRDRNIVDTVRTHAVEGMDADDIMEKLAGARQMSPDASPVWPALDDTEAPEFGEAVYRHLLQDDPERHVDVSGAAILPAAGVRRRVADRRFDGTFAEDTVWEKTSFVRCEFTNSSFCRARFTGCEFHDCRFVDTNLSKAELAGCRFAGCTFDSLRIVEPTWFESVFQGCVFEQVSMSDVAMRDSTFEGGSWHRVDIADALMMDVTWRDLALKEVTLSEVMAPQNRFERIAMTKVWVMAKGPAGSTFEDIEADTCGFLGNVRFDRSSFSRARFTMTGFTNAVFADTTFDAGCRFDRCDLSGAMFLNAAMEGARFIQCSMTGSKWSNVKAPNAWFFGALLRGVDFGDTELANAVFADADLEGTKMLPDRTIGADFRGTVRADS